MASGQVEKNVQDARPRLWQPHYLKLGPDFPDLAALNDWLEQRCKALWQKIPHGSLTGTVADAWAEEQAALMPVPPAFDGFIELSKRVSPTCLISFEREEDQETIRGVVSPTQGYSVPCCGLPRPHWGHGPFAPFANRPVSLRVYPDRLVIAAEGQILCEHARRIDCSHQLPPRTVYDWRHYLAVIRAANLARSGMAPCLPDCHQDASSCRNRCCDVLVETARWSISLHWSCTMTSKLF